MKIVIVHDFLTQWGGAENVVDTLAEIFPDATIATSLVDKKVLKGNLLKRKIITSFLQHIPFKFKLYRFFLLLYPVAFYALNLKKYDLIISSSAYFGKFVRKRKDAFHINYCHTPMRSAWLIDEYLEKETIPFYLKKIIKFCSRGLKILDLKANSKVDLFLANSQNVQERIKKFYNRDSLVVYPPVNLPTDILNNFGDYYLIVSRLKPYKRIDIAVDACTRMKKKLYVVGMGESLQELKSIAGPTIEFYGYLDDLKLNYMIANCKAMIFPGEEDFGIVPVEAQAYGKAVIAFNRGGALETVIDRVTGIFFDNQTIDSLENAIRRYETLTIDPEKCKQNSKNFSKQVFIDKLTSIVNEYTSIFKGKV